MYTTTFIIILLAVVAFFNSRIRNYYLNSQKFNHFRTSEKEELMKMPINIFLLFGFVIIFLGIAIINISDHFKSDQELEKALYNIENLEESQTSIPNLEVEKPSSIINSSVFVDVGDKQVACSMAKDFIKLDLQNPATADFDLLDCTSEQNYDLSYTVMRKVSAKNALGVEKEYIYKIVIGFNGGEKYDRSSWKLVSMRSEEYR